MRNMSLRDMTEFQDISEAFHISMFRLADAPLVHPRGHATKELSPYAFFVNDTSRLFVFNPFRHVNPFAQIAETLWMLAGRNDLGWLERYIPGCKRWSDDGQTWRAAYGPRLRRWKNEYMSPPVDQVKNVLQLLSKDSDTRQAVISLWDPAADWVDSKDIPCNNWLQFMVRNGCLNLHVAVRSNDAVFGFSHVDFFQWAVLQHMISFWNGYDPGYIYWTAGSFHIYERHFQMADSMYLVDHNQSYYTKYNLLPFIHLFRPSHFAIDAQFGKFFSFVDWLWSNSHHFSNTNYTSISNVFARYEISDPFFQMCCIAMAVHRWAADEVGQRHVFDLLNAFMSKDFDLYHAIVQYYHGQRLTTGQSIDEDISDRYYEDLNKAVQNISTH